MSPFIPPIQEEKSFKRKNDEDIFGLFPIKKIQHQPIKIFDELKHTKEQLSGICDEILSATDPTVHSKSLEMCLDKLGAFKLDQINELLDNAILIDKLYFVLKLNHIQFIKSILLCLNSAFARNLSRKNHRNILDSFVKKLLDKKLDKLLISIMKTSKSLWLQNNEKLTFRLSIVFMTNLLSLSSVDSDLRVRLLTSPLNNYFINLLKQDNNNTNNEHLDPVIHNMIFNYILNLTKLSTLSELESFFYSDISLLMKYSSDYLYKSITIKKTHFDTSSTPPNHVQFHNPQCPNNGCLHNAQSSFQIPNSLKLNYIIKVLNMLNKLIKIDAGLDFFVSGNTMMDICFDIVSLIKYRPNHVQYRIIRFTITLLQSALVFNKENPHIKGVQKSQFLAKKIINFKKINILMDVLVCLNDKLELEDYNLFLSLMILLILYSDLQSPENRKLFNRFRLNNYQLLSILCSKRNVIVTEIATSAHSCKRFIFLQFFNIILYWCYLYDSKRVMSLLESKEIEYDQLETVLDDYLEHLCDDYNSEEIEDVKTGELHGDNEKISEKIVRLLNIYKSRFTELLG